MTGLECHTRPFISLFHSFHLPTQKATVLAVEECVTVDIKLSAINLLCFGGFRSRADDPPKLWRARSDLPAAAKAGFAKAGSLQRPGAQVGLVFGDHGLARGAPFQ